MSYSAAERVYREVKELILAGDLPGGDLISEGDIASRFACSRTPVREAFLRLEAEGWMRLYPKRGALIVPVAADEARHVIEARYVVETHAVAALVADGQARARLDTTLGAVLDLQNSLAAAGDVPGFGAQDAAFHEAIVDAAANPLLSAFYRTLRERQRRMTTASVGDDLARLHRILEDHRGLAALAVAGDAAGYAEAVATHMRAVHDLDPRPGARTTENER